MNIKKVNNEYWFTVIITFVFLSTGLLFLHLELIGYGLSLFVFIPFILGYFLGEGLIKKMSLFGFIFSLITFLVLLYFGGLEGMVCILMAMPIVLFFIGCGVIVQNVYKFFFGKKQSTKNKLQSTLAPLAFVLTIGVLEHQFTQNNLNHEVLESEMILPFTTLEVYKAIKSVDTLNVTLPFLMKLDLPIPRKCVLNKEEVGGIRTCYFDGGNITQKIVDIEVGKFMEMEVIDYELTGRDWLKFHEAAYYFEDLGDGKSKISRTTSYSSALYPRFYWKPLEKLGLQQEHDYVFRNLKKDLFNSQSVTTF